jgi:hypothetical protein
MPAKMVLTSEPGSLIFSDKVLYLHQEEVMVSRSSKENKPHSHNAVFDCKVRNIYKCKVFHSSIQTMSRPQAALKLENGGLCLTDLGSSNGTFVNNMRLNEQGEVCTGDIVGWGDGGRLGMLLLSLVQVWLPRDDGRKGEGEMCGGQGGDFVDG